MRPHLLGVIGACFFGICGHTFAVTDPPEWWEDMGVTNSAPPNDFGVANIGQAKWMASKALLALHAHNPYWAARVRSELKRVTDLTIPSSPSPEWLAKQKAPLQLGQLKALSKPFYKALHAETPNWLDHESAAPSERGQLQINGTKDQVDAANFLPWSSSALDDKNTAVANIGQLKAVFSLRFEDIPNPFVDVDWSGADDSWETLHGVFPFADPDEDGIINYLEYVLGFDPNSSPSERLVELAQDRDDDGMPDWYEASRFNYTFWEPPVYMVNRTLDWDLNDADGDYDQDGIANLEEYEAGLDPVNPDTDGDDVTDGSDAEPLVFNISTKMSELVDAMEDAVDTRISGKTASSAMPLFSNTTAKWTSTTFTPNISFWLNDIREKFTGIHMYAGGWTQSYGLMPITPRHCVSCNHNGPRVGDTVRYVKDDGTVFETTIVKWVHDAPDVNIPSSDPKGPPVADLSVYLLADPFPSWVAKLPIFPALTSGQRRMLSELDAPLVCISQGNRDEPGFSGDQLTPNNRKAYITNHDLRQQATGDRAAFFHGRTVGDSGTPEYIIIGDEVYLYGVIDALKSGVPVGNYIGYINSLIARADAAASISTGYTVSNAAWPLP